MLLRSLYEGGANFKALVINNHNPCPKDFSRLLKRCIHYFVASAVLSQFSKQHSGGGFTPCEYVTKWQGEEPAHVREDCASKHRDGHWPLMSGERMQGDVRDARIAKGRGVERVGST